MTRHTQVEILLSERIINLPFISGLHEREDLCRTEPSDVIVNNEPETYDILPLDNSAKKVPVVAIDCSNVQLGCGGGFSYEAARAAMVTRTPKGRVQVTKIGPLVAKSPVNQGSILYALEAFAQGLAIEQVKDGIVLLDGSLPPNNTLYRVRRGTKVVDLSKTIPPQDIKDEAYGFPPEPFVLIRRPSNSCLVRLSRGGFVLMGKVFSSEPEEMQSTFSSLAVSDALDMGYPETLKLAHIFSKILPTEGLSAKIAIMRKHGVRLFDPLDGRKLLLGSMWG